MNAKVEAALRTAAGLEARQQFEAAAEAYRRAIAAAEAGDHSLLGMLHINVGNAQRNARLTDEAIASYGQAAKLLEGQKGEAMLQRGYALLNLASQLLIKNDPQAVATSAEALKIHRLYPYTTATDLADAVALHFLARLFLEQTAAEADFHAAWDEVKEAPCAGIIRSFAFDFVSNYLLFIKHAYPDQYPAARAEVEAWALPDLFAEAAALAEGGPDAYQAVHLQHRLQRGTMGIPDPDSS